MPTAYAKAQNLFAPNLGLGVKAAGGGGGCTTATDKVDGGTLNDPTADVYEAGFVDASANTETICQIGLLIYGDNALNFTVNLEIWSYGSGVPGSLITSFGSVPAASLPDIPTGSGWTSGVSGIFTNFTGTWSKSSGTPYVFVTHLTGPDAASNTTNRKWWSSNIGDPGHHTFWKSSDGSSWTAIDIVNLDRVEYRSFK